MTNQTSIISPNTGSNPKDLSQILEQKKILLLEQQEQIKIKYKQLKTLFENQGLEDEQKQLLQEQMQKLDDLYSQNKQTLQQISSGDGFKPKKQKKLSKKILMLIIAGGLSFLLGIVVFVFSYLLQNSLNSEVIKSMGTNIMLAQVSSMTFFVVFSLFGLTILAYNLYEFIKNKKSKKNKAKKIVFMSTGFLLVLLSVIVLFVVGSLVKKAEDIERVNLSKIIFIYADIKDNKQLLGKDPMFVSIAPINMSFELNRLAFDRQILSQVGSIKNVYLDCGNGQTLGMLESKFDGQCFYTGKGKYPIKLKINHLVDSQEADVSFLIDEIDIKSQINVSVENNNLIYAKNEILVGYNPTNVFYDASEVFKEFQLSEYKIMRDIDGDGQYENYSLTKYSYLYTDARVYDVAVKFPDLNDYIYTFPLRVEPTDKLAADIKYIEINNLEYDIYVDFHDEGILIYDYLFEIMDSNNKKIGSISTKDPNITYQFPGNGTYFVNLTFMASDGKQTTIKGDNLEIGGSKFRIYYDLYSKTPTKPDFQKLEKLDNIVFDELPVLFKIDVTNIIPSTPTIKIQVLIDDSPLISTNNIFQTTIDTPKDYKVKIIVTDTATNEKTEKDINISVKRRNIVESFLVSPDTVGTSPFTVTFDVSATTITDDGDEIVYFSRDFGDGDKKMNLSQSIINHTYEYDFDKENGTFSPTVSIVTKKGHKMTLGTDVTILVKKPVVNLEINIDSHPTQVANVGSKVDMSLTLEGTPERILWDFGNGNKYECKSRECTSMSEVYIDPGTYTVKVSAYFADRSPVEGTITLKIR